MSSYLHNLIDEKTYLIRQGRHLSLDQLDNPESASLKHCVSVVPVTHCLNIADVMRKYELYANAKNTDWSCAPQ